MAWLEGVRNRFFKRALDFWTCLFIFILGLYGVFYAPEHLKNATSGLTIFVDIIAIYYIISSLVILATIVLDPVEHPNFVRMGQLFGWLFIACAAASTLILYAASLFTVGPPQFPYEFFIWVIIWASLLTLSLSHIWHITKKGANG